MRKMILFCLACLFAGICGAQEKTLTGGLFEHVIDVEAYDDWGKGYLTVIDNHCFVMEGVKYLTAFEPILDTETTPRDPESGELIIPDEAIPILGVIIYEVNGQSTLNMTKEEFYNITDGASSFTLKYGEYGPEDKTYTYTFERLTEKVNIINNYAIPYFTKNEVKYEFGLPKFLSYNNLVFARKREQKKYCGNAISEVSDENYDFHSVSTYAYLLEGDDQLNDKKILDEINTPPNWEFDNEHPDILFTIKKRMDGDLYMEIAALDIKRLDKKNENNAPSPVVWKMIVRRTIENNENVIEAYKDYAGWACLSLNDRYVYVRYPIYQTSGIELNKSRIVTKVYDNALCSFLQEGDEIIKIESFRNCQYRYKKFGDFWNVENEKKVYKKDDITLSNLHEELTRRPSARNYLTETDKGCEIKNINDYIVITYKHDKKKYTHIVRPKSTIAERTYLLNKEEMGKL